MGDPRPTLSELHEFRTVIATAKAAYLGDGNTVTLLTSLIESPENAVYAMRALITCLLAELATQKRDPLEVLTELAEQTATAETTADPR